MTIEIVDATTQIIYYGRYRVFCDRPINKFPRVLPKYEPQPNKNEYGPQPNELDEEDEHIPQANETIVLENYDPKYCWKREKFREIMEKIYFPDDDDENDPEYNLRREQFDEMIRNWTYFDYEDYVDEEEYDDDDEIEEFVEPEFNPELEIHNELKSEINELDDELIPQINDDTEPNPKDDD
jgi:hypothetical protein